jgi:hypothetical protein
VGVIVVGTIYRPNWGGINFTQPGGPYTTVYPQEQVNVPFAAYPTGGQLWAENSGIWVAGCGHWQNEPMIFQDFDGFVVTLAFLQDSLGRNWQIGVSNDGTQIIATQVAFTANSVVLLTDLVTAQTYQLTVIPNGANVDLQLAPVGGSGGQEQLLVLSANGTLYGIQVSNGVLETAYPLAAEGSPVAIVTCNLCSYVQYVIPQAQFYDTFRTPVTII